jgi:CxxC motif-containing protein
LFLATLELYNSEKSTRSYLVQGKRCGIATNHYHHDVLSPRAVVVGSVRCGNESSVKTDTPYDYSKIS